MKKGAIARASLPRVARLSGRRASLAPSITIRPSEPGDAADLQRLVTAPGVVHGTMQLPSRSRAEIRKRFLEPSPDRHAFVAVVGGRVVGYAGLILGGSPRARHKADLWMMVLDDHQGRGVGTALMQALVDLADRWLGLVRIGLHVNVDNARAIRLYEKFGFEHEGRVRADVLRDGEYVDSFLMGRIRKPPASRKTSKARRGART